MGYGKGRAIGYSDFYKNNDKTPDGEYDDEEETSSANSFSVKVTMPRNKSQGNMSDQRKAALRRRLMKRKQGS